MRERHWHWFGALLITCALLTITLPTAAQEIEPPPRHSDRIAPVRTPVMKQSADSPEATQALFELPVVADAYIASGAT